MHIQTLCSHPVNCNVRQHVLPHSLLFMTNEFENLTDGQTDRMKKKEIIRLLSINLSINRSLLLYLSFALIRENISEYHVTLKTEAHYILQAITSEFLPHLPEETVVNGSAASFIITGLFLVDFVLLGYFFFNQQLENQCNAPRLLDLF